MSSVTFATKVVDQLSDALKQIRSDLKGQHDDKQFSSSLAGELVCVRNALLMINEDVIEDSENRPIASLLAVLEKMSCPVVSAIKHGIATNDRDAIDQSPK